MNKIRQHIIFDLDGTVIDSKKEILKTYQLVFSEVRPRIKIDPETLNYGATIQNVLKGVYGNEENLIEAAKKSFSSRYDSSNYDETHLYDGVIETLEILKKNNHLLYIATNKRFAPTTRILQRKKIGHYFSDVKANEMQPGITLSKEQMISDLKRAHFFTAGYMVGDTISDIRAGNSQNLKTIAVTYGYENRDIFAAQNPTFIIDSFKEILTFI